MSADAPTGPEGEIDGHVVAPTFALIPSAADGDAEPVSRIRAQLVSVAEGALLAFHLQDVSPTAASWTIRVGVPLASEDAEAILYVQLLHVDDDRVESVQFSGRTEPFTLRQDVPMRPEIDLVRGPPANLEVTSVTITSQPGSLLVGETVSLTATATTSGDVTPTILWTSLETTVVTMSGSTARAVALGTAHIVASAGAFADTVSIVVAPDDEVPPEVIGVVPGGGATAVSVGTLVIATFDEPLDPVSVTGTSLTLRTAAGVPVAGAVTYSGSQILFDPTLPLDTLTAFTATVAPGVRDTSGNTRTASFQWTFTTSAQRLAVVSSFNPGLSGALIAIAFDPATGNLFVYDDFATSILELTPAGAQVLPAIPNPGNDNSNDHDLDFLPETVNVGGTTVSANALLVMNGEDTPLRRVYAIDKSTGAELASTTISTANPVGLSYHSGRNTFFAIDWTAEVVQELDPSTGAMLASFPVRPAGSPLWTTFYGDVEVDQRSGNLILVSSDQPVVRFLSPTGVFLADVAVGGLGVTNMAGIAWDDATATAWITTTSGQVLQLVGLTP